MARNFDPATLGELMETVVETRRVSKTVKGGRIMRFAAVVVVGDQNGHVGYGIGKSAEVPEAIRKAIEDAKKNMIEVSLKNTTIPHDIIGEFGAAKVVLKPAAEGPFCGDHAAACGAGQLLPALAPARRCAF